MENVSKNKSLFLVDGSDDSTREQDPMTLREGVPPPIPRLKLPLIVFPEFKHAHIGLRRDRERHVGSTLFGSPDLSTKHQVILVHLEHSFFVMVIERPDKIKDVHICSQIDWRGRYTSYRVVRGISRNVQIKQMMAELINYDGPDFLLMSAVSQKGRIVIKWIVVNLKETKTFDDMKDIPDLYCGWNQSKFFSIHTWYETTKTNGKSQSERYFLMASLTIEGHIEIRQLPYKDLKLTHAFELSEKQMIEWPSKSNETDNHKIIHFDVWHRVDGCFPIYILVEDKTNYHFCFFEQKQKDRFELIKSWSLDKSVHIKSIINRIEAIHLKKNGHQLILHNDSIFEMTAMLDSIDKKFITVMITVFKNGSRW